MRWPPGRLRHRTWYGIGELNGAVADLTAWLNDRVMRQFGRSRRQLCEELDAPHLKAVPHEPKILAQWRRCKFGLEYHVEVGWHFCVVWTPGIHIARGFWFKAAFQEAVLGVMDRLVLSDGTQARMAPLIIGRPDEKGSTGHDNRMFLEVVLWIVRTASPWRDLPEAFGDWNSAFRRFSRWSEKDLSCWMTSTFVAGLKHDGIRAPMLIDTPMTGLIFQQ